MAAPTVEAAGDTASYGYGLWLGKLEGHPGIYHGGSISGFQSSLVHYPEDELTIAVLMNSDQGDPEQLEEALARAAFGMELRDLPPTAEEMTRYEGLYSLQAEEGMVKLRVYAEKERLHAELVGQGVTPLLYQGDGVFLAARDHDIRLVFTREGRRSEGLTFYLGRQVFSGVREP